MSTPLLVLDEISKVYGSGDTAVRAVDAISLTVERGELVALMGTSGSGKSTVLALAGGLTSPTSGEVQIDGTNLAALSARRLARLRRRTIGFIFQEYNLVPSLTAVENVALPLELDGWNIGRARVAAREALTLVELAGLEARYPADLSGGQRQRVAIARAVVGPRELILADEPTGALDSENGERVLALLRRRVDAGAGGLLVTHDPAFAAWADRVVFLRDGRAIDESQSERPLTTQSAAEASSL